MERGGERVVEVDELIVIYVFIVSRSLDTQKHFSTVDVVVVGWVV
jgi:hypothetical protein